MTSTVAHMVMRGIASLCIFCVLIAPKNGLSQELDSIPHQFRNHPDGVVGQISLHGQAHYASVSKDPGFRALDAQTYRLGLHTVVSSRITLETEYEALKLDSVRHSLSGGFKYYLKNPLQKNTFCNPDGQIGGVVLNLAVGARFSDSPGSATRMVGDFNVTLPVSARLSLAAGYRYYEAIEVNDVVQGYGRLAIFFSDYPPDSAYVNPDGPVGYPVLSLSGGGSSNGFFGEIALKFPLDGKISLKSVFSAERVASPYQLSLSAGVGVSVYSQK